MHRTNPLLFFLVTLLISLSPACAGLVDGSDPRAKPIKDAVAVLVKQITAGDFDKAKAEYAGEKKDLELLKAYVDAYTATKSMRGQLVAKFGEQYKEPVGFDTLVEKTAVIDFNSVIFDDKDPDHAAASTDTAMGTGIEFKRVGGKWKVLSLASEPETPEQHLGRLRKYIPAVKQISDKLKSGKYATAEAVDADIGSAHELLHGR
jgi:hypothetical protein